MGIPSSWDSGSSSANDEMVMRTIYFNENNKFYYYSGTINLFIINLAIYYLGVIEKRELNS